MRQDCHVQKELFPLQSCFSRRVERKSFATEIHFTEKKRGKKVASASRKHLLYNSGKKHLSLLPPPFHPHRSLQQHKEKAASSTNCAISLVTHLETSSIFGDKCSQSAGVRMTRIVHVFLAVLPMHQLAGPNYRQEHSPSVTRASHSL